MYEVYMKIMKLFANKNSNDISNEIIEPVLMKFHIQHLYDGFTKFW